MNGPRNDMPLPRLQAGDVASIHPGLVVTQVKDECHELCFAVVAAVDDAGRVHAGSGALFVAEVDVSEDVVIGPREERHAKEGNVRLQHVPRTFHLLHGRHSVERTRSHP